MSNRSALVGAACSSSDDSDDATTDEPVSGGCWAEIEGTRGERSG